MRVITWNVNGLRSVLSKEKNGTKHSGHIENNVVYALLKEQDPDILCLQEIKCNAAPPMKLVELGYKYCSFNYATVRKGYSGTCIICKEQPLSETMGIGESANEGRVLTVEFDKFYVVNVYTPNSKPDLSRLEFRVNVWDKAFREYVQRLQKHKYVIVCGDFNVAPDNIDVNNPKSAEGSHGFTKAERESFKLLDLCDSFRYLHKDAVAYSWFSPFANSRAKNKGWRIDHLLVSKKLQAKLTSADIHGEYYGSDHVPCSVNILI